MNVKAKAFMAAVMGTLLLPLAAPAQEAPALQLQELLSAEQFKRSGLNKLTDQELAILNECVSDLAVRLAAALSGAAGPTAEVIESQIDGTFNGWDGETVFKLMNGQIWQQTSYDYLYHYSYMPDVLIYKSGGTYKMKVEDVNEVIQVRRLK